MFATIPGSDDCPREVLKRVEVNWVKWCVFWRSVSQDLEGEPELSVGEAETDKAGRGGRMPEKLVGPGMKGRGCQDNSEPEKVRAGEEHGLTPPVGRVGWKESWVKSAVS